MRPLADLLAIAADCPPLVHSEQRDWVIGGLDVTDFRASAGLVAVSPQCFGIAMLRDQTGLLADEATFINLT